MRSAPMARKSSSNWRGLGVAVSQAIVEMHCGTIRAESEGLGKGAKFLIQLPATAPAE
jgi:signal transduction histidine kinase